MKDIFGLVPIRIRHKIHFITINCNLHEGFIDHETKSCYYTDHQIFDKFHKYRSVKGFARHETLSLNEIVGLHPGDYIVHIDHGIGVFGGLEKIEIKGKYQECVRLVYKDKDILYVSIHSLHKISKYKGKDGVPPKIYKLGTGTWQKLKQKTKSKVKDIARDLISLYAKRKSGKGFSFSPDSYLSKELEASFLFEDTPDQVKATKSVKQDMESASPMDRLICGDVGFGKTEIAIRAAFKAVADSKQVAIMVPTTILALQHYNTFGNRLANFPCNTNYISRTKKPKEQKQILEQLKEGKIDILIGTHRLLGKDVEFKDLGLLIIDEEQKFGVSAKEKIKKLKTNVDTLIMTATPIPRTLQFSLMGARDLSIIHTPPPNRQPIYTEIHSFNTEIIKEAILFEKSRQGQVFFIHNRIQNISEITEMIRESCPTISIAIAHGQIDGVLLENTMLEFIRGKYDVLVATTIIENGLDIPNANTIIINNAHQFGLSDLHQLRGRVGRSNTKAFCYLLSPALSILTPDARRRIKAIEDFSDLGSGFNIALQDMDIRGTGNLLGAEQSGFIADIGFDTYQKILNEAIQELKEKEFKQFYTINSDQQAVIDSDNIIGYVPDCQVDTDMEILFPEHYIENISERIKLYRELDNIKSEERLQAFENQIIDRFGQLPEESIELFNVVRLRWFAIKLGIEKLSIRNGNMLLNFVSDPDSLFYQSNTFSNVLSFVKNTPNLCKLQEKKNKLVLTIARVSSIFEAIGYLKTINNRPGEI